MSNSTNSTNVAALAVVGSFVSLLVPFCVIAICCGSGYKAKKAYDRRSKRYNYKEVPVVKGRIISPRAPPTVNAVPVAPARIIPPVQATAVQAIDEFFRAWGITSFPCRKIDLERLSTLVNSGFNIDKVFYAGASMYVTLKAKKYANDKTYLIDLMFKQNTVLENNPLSQPESIETDRIVSYSAQYILRIYNLYKESAA